MEISHQSPEAVRRRRMHLGVSQRRLAAIVGVSREVIAKYETGTYLIGSRSPTIQKVFSKLAELEQEQLMHLEQLEPARSHERAQELVHNLEHLMYGDTLTEVERLELQQTLVKLGQMERREHVN